MPPHAIEPKDPRHEYLENPLDRSRFEIIVRKRAHAGLGPALARESKQGLHAHHCDYFYVVIGDGELEALNADGSLLHRGTMQDGEVHYRGIDEEPAVTKP